MFQDQTYKGKNLCVSLHCAALQRAEDISFLCFQIISVASRQWSTALNSNQISSPAVFDKWSLQHLNHQTANSNTENKSRIHLEIGTPILTGIWLLFPSAFSRHSYSKKDTEQVIFCSNFYRGSLNKIWTWFCLQFSEPISKKVERAKQVLNPRGTRDFLSNRHK